MLTASHLLPWAKNIAYITSFNPHSEADIMLTISWMRKLESQSFLDLSQSHTEVGEGGVSKCTLSDCQSQSTQDCIEL